MDIPEDDLELLAEVGFDAPELLGRGDFACVYRVRVDGEYCALKLSHADTPEQRERIPREVDALRALDHPSIPKLISEGEARRRPFIVMSLYKIRVAVGIIHKGQASGRPWKYLVDVLDEQSVLYEFRSWDEALDAAVCVGRLDPRADAVVLLRSVLRHLPGRYASKRAYASAVVRARTRRRGVGLVVGS